MIEISYKHMNDYPVSATLQVLIKERMDGATAFHVGKIAQAVAKEEKHMRKLYVDLVKAYVDGWEPGKELDVPAEKKESLTSAENEFFDTGTFRVERDKIDFGLLTKLQLTPAQVLALEPFLDNLP